MRELIAILRGVKPDEVVAIGNALIKSGITKIEVPLNSPQPMDSIQRLLNEFGDTALIGAGTVLQTSDVDALSEIGAHMIVSPNANPEVIRATKSHGLLSYPGVFTPTEAFSAIDAGADALKLFPASLLGLDGFKAIKAVLPGDTRFYPVGGVAAPQFRQWLDAGATGFGIGSALYKPGDSPAVVEARALEMVDAIE